MSLRYDKLWKMMKDNKMNKTQLKQAASVSQYLMSKMKRNEPVPMEVMMKLFIVQYVIENYDEVL